MSSSSTPEGNVTSLPRYLVVFWDLHLTLFFKRTDAWWEWEGFYQKMAFFQCPNTPEGSSITHVSLNGCFLCPLINFRVCKISAPSLCFLMLNSWEKKCTPAVDTAATVNCPLCLVDNEWGDTPCIPCYHRLPPYCNPGPPKVLLFIALHFIHFKYTSRELKIQYIFCIYNVFSLYMVQCIK